VFSFELRCHGLCGSQKYTSNTFYGFLVNSSKAWEWFQLCENPREAVINYYRQLTLVSDEQGYALVLDVEKWKAIAKLLNATLYVYYPHVSLLLPTLLPNCETSQP